MANENLKTSLNRTYSYDDFVSEANRLGLLGQFSDADLKLAQQNPDAGMSILGYKNDYRNATTDEARALANQGANSVRSSWGGYTGGGDGGSFKLNPLSPGSFSYQDAPTYTGQYAGDIADLWKQQRDYSPFSYSRQNDLTAALDKVVNRKDFSYDASTDPLYAQYRKQYTREGQRATADALGQAAAASGGRVSSWAQTAANQAANYYAGQMTDKIPELYQLAYQKYLNDFQMDQSGLQALQSDRSAEQGEWQGNLNALTGKLNTAQALEQADYSKFLNELNQYNTDRSFAYNQLLDEVGQQTQLRQEATQQRQQERDNAMALYQLMGYAPEDAAKILGIESGTPTLAGRERDDAQKQQEWANQYNIANLGGSYGDFSGLNALGITPDTQNLLKLALANAGRTSPVGSGTTGGGGGGGGTAKPVLTLAQMEAAIEAGNLSPNVLAAYEYYYGEPYGGTGGASSGMNESQFGQEARVIMQYLGQGMDDRATDRLNYIWDSLSKDQQAQLRAALKKHGIEIQ